MDQEIQQRLDNLPDGTIVLQDRWADSTYVYQLDGEKAIGDPDPFSQVRYPDLTFYLPVPPSIAYSRLVFRGVLMVAFLFGCLDGLGAAGMKMDAFAFLPLFDKGLAWLMPTLLACVVGVMVRPTEMAAEAA